MNMKNTTFLQSIRCACMGFIKAASTEKNFIRYGFLAVLFFILNLLVFRISFTQHIIYFAVCCGAFSAECINTSVERLADTFTHEISESIGAVKDIAAAGVLMWGTAYFGTEALYLVMTLLKTAGLL